MKNAKNFIALFCGIIIPLFCNAAFRLTTSELNTLDINKTATEKRNYFDTELQTYRKGQTDGSLSPSTNRDAVMQTTSELQTTNSSKLATKHIFYWDTLTSHYFFGKEDGGLEPLIVQKLFFPHGEITATEVLDNSGLRDQSNNGEIQPGRSYTFDGINDYVDAGDILGDVFVSNNYSLITRVKAFEDKGMILSKWFTAPSTINQNGFILYPTAFITDGSSVALPPLSLNSWVNIIVSVENGYAKIYYNGTLVAESESNKSEICTRTLQFGGWSTTKSEYDFKGEIQEAIILSRPLSETEISNYNSGIIPSNSIEAHYKMDESNGTIAYDSSGNGHHGIISNATLSTFHSTAPAGNDWQNQVGYTEDEDGSLTGTSGVLIPRDESAPTLDVLGNTLEFSGRVNYNAKLVESNCGSFDGVNDHVSATGFDNDVFTISAWVKKASSGSTWQGLIEFDNSNLKRRGLGFNGANMLVTYGDGKVRTAAAAFPTDQWKHVVGTYDGTSSILYIDGESVTLDGEVSSSAAPVTPLKLSIGDYSALTSSLPFQGSIANVQIYDHAISISEVSSLFQEDIIPEGLIAHYPLAEGSGTIIYDASGNGNHGTATNITEANFWGETQDVYHHNLRKGFSISGNTKVPANIMGEIDAQGNTLTNPRSYFHNGAETKIQQHPAPELMSKDINNVYFDTSEAPKSLGVSDFTSNMSGDNRITSQTTSAGYKQNLLWLGR